MERPNTVDRHATRGDLVRHVALAFAKRINPDSTQGNSMDMAYAELALDAIESSSAMIGLSVPADEIDQDAECLVRIPAGHERGGEQFVFFGSTGNDVTLELTVDGPVYVPLEPGQ